MKEKSAYFDCDGTLFPGHIMPEWIDFLAKRGVIESGFKLGLKKLPIYLKYLSHFATYAQTVTEVTNLYTRALIGKEAAVVKPLMMEFGEEYSKRAFPFVEQLTEETHGLLKIGIITGAQQEIVKQALSGFKVSEVHGLVLEEKDGIYTGNMVECPNIKVNKEKKVNELLKENDFVLCAGDTGEDESLLKNAKVKLFIGSKIGKIPEDIKKCNFIHVDKPSIASAFPMSELMQALSIAMEENYKPLEAVL